MPPDNRFPVNHLDEEQDSASTLDGAADCALDFLLPAALGTHRAAAGQRVVEHLTGVRLVPPLARGNRPYYQHHRLAPHLSTEV